MSKVREHVPLFSGDLEAPPEGDLRAYVVFTRLKPDGPYFYAGWLDAADDVMALQFSREHYGQDQVCCGIWCVPKKAIAGTDGQYPPQDDEGPERSFRVFHEKRHQGHVSGDTVLATSSVAAIEKARTIHADDEETTSIWVVPETAIAATDPGDLIWRHCDQSYRLARGYAKDVRAKWEKVREERALREYEKDDLHEAF
ncbi:MAG: hypothetical protein ACYTGC_01365 [Planctomycetota bacterium]|jgi:1,2-phenylacetyl-CoA epoxidase PaaB subunit